MPVTLVAAARNFFYALASAVLGLFGVDANLYDEAMAAEPSTERNAPRLGGGPYFSDPGLQAGFARHVTEYHGVAEYALRVGGLGSFARPRPKRSRSQKRRDAAATAAYQPRVCLAANETTVVVCHGDLRTEKCLVTQDVPGVYTVRYPSITTIAMAGRTKTDMVVGYANGRQGYFCVEPADDHMRIVRMPIKPSEPPENAVFYVGQTHRQRFVTATQYYVRLSGQHWHSVQIDGPIDAACIVPSYGASYCMRGFSTGEYVAVARAGHVHIYAIDDCIQLGTSGHWPVPCATVEVRGASPNTRATALCALDLDLDGVHYFAAIGYADGAVVLLAAPTKLFVLCRDNHRGPVVAMAAHPASERLAVARGNGTVLVVDLVPTMRVYGVRTMMGGREHACSARALVYTRHASYSTDGWWCLVALTTENALVGVGDGVAVVVGVDV